MHDAHQPLHPPIEVLRVDASSGDTVLFKLKAGGGTGDINETGGGKFVYQKNAFSSMGSQQAEVVLAFRWGMHAWDGKACDGMIWHDMASYGMGWDGRAYIGVFDLICFCVVIV